MLRTIGRSFLLLSVGLTACGGTAKKETKQPDPPPPPVEQNQLSSEQKNACNAFLAAVEEALEIHVRPRTADRNFIMAEAFYDTLSKISGWADPTRSATFQETRKKLEEQTKGGVSDCGPYIALADALPYEPENNTPPLVEVLRVALGQTVSNMNIHSSYATPADLAARSVATLHGAGVRILERPEYWFGDWDEKGVEGIQGRRASYLVVKGWYPGSPNESKIRPKDAPLKIGSRIVEINGKKVSSMTFHKASFLLNRPDAKFVASETKGRDGVEVKLAGSNASIKLEYGTYSKEVAYLELLPDDPGAASDQNFPDDRKVAHLSLETFNSDNTSSDLVGAWFQALQEKASGSSTPWKALILDLRQNTGGAEEQSKRILQTLLPLGSIGKRVLFPSILVGPKDDVPDDEKCELNGKTFFCKTVKTETEWLIDIPAVVVLVDRHSASASELVTSSLRDYGRALVVGEKTYGKGTTQMDYPVAGPLGGKMTLLVGLFWSPAGHSHQFTGITPEFMFPDAVSDWQVKRADPKTYPNGFPVRLSDSFAMSNRRDKDIFIAQNPGEYPLDRKDFVATTDRETHTHSPKDYATLVDRVRAATKDKTPTSCGILPSTDASKPFPEEKDCLLDWGVTIASELARQLEIERSTPVAQR